MHCDRLLHRHAPNAVGPGRLAGGSHGRIAVDARPQHVQAGQRGPQALLSRAAAEQRLIKDQARSVVRHGREPQVPDVLDGPERGPHGHRAVRFEQQPRPGIGAPAGEGLDQDVHAEREPLPGEYLLQGPRDRGLP